MLSLITWPTAILGCFVVLVLALFSFFTIVYLKEFAREEKAIRDFTKFREQQAAQMEKELLYVIQPSPPKKKKEKIVVDATPVKKKNDRDVN